MLNTFLKYKLLVDSNANMRLQFQYIWEYLISMYFPPQKKWINRETASVAMAIRWWLVRSWPPSSARGTQHSQLKSSDGGERKKAQKTGPINCCWAPEGHETPIIGPVSLKTKKSKQASKLSWCCWRCMVVVLVGERCQLSLQFLETSLSRFI